MGIEIPKWAQDFKNEHGFMPMAGGSPDGDGGGEGGDGGNGGNGGGAGGDGGNGGGAGGDGGNGGGNGNAPVAVEHDPAFAALIPADFKEKPWVKETKDIPALFKRVDGLLTEMGKRPAGIPQKNAKPEERAAFNKAFGVPDKAEDYKFPDPPQGAPAADVEFQTSIKNIFHKRGVSAEQAAGIVEDWNAMQAEAHKKNGELSEAEQTKADQEFDALTGEVFGNRKDEALKGSKILIAKYAPEKMKAHLDKLDNNSLVIMASVLDSIRKEFISEDRMPQGGNAPIGMTAEQRQARGRELMASAAYSDPFHADHEKVKDEVQRLYGTK